MKINSSEQNLVIASPRILILGGGAVVTQFYLPALRSLGMDAGVTVLDTSSSNLLALSKLYPNVKIEQKDFREFLKEPFDQQSYEACVIALPNHLHTEAVDAALRCGLNVLCEKPLALDEESCWKLSGLSEETGKILVVGMVRRLLPSVTALREALENGLIGSLKSVDIEHGGPYGWLSNTGDFFRRENGGVLADMGSHYLDLVMTFIGPLRPVSYVDDYCGGVEANSEFYLASENDLPVRLSLSRTRALRDTAIFRGEYGELVLEKDTFDSCLLKSYKEANLIARIYPRKPFRGGDWPANLGSCFAEQLVDFVSAIQGESSPYVNAREAALTTGLIEWAYSNRDGERALAVGDSPKIEPAMVLSPAKVVVTGGTGFIGSNLIGRLVNLGFDEIAAPVRNYRTCAEVARYPVKLPCVDLLDYEQVKANINGARWVFHLAYGKDGSDPAKITIDGTRNVVNAAVECGAECVVVLSTMYVLGHPDTDELVNESWPYRPAGGEYGKSKAKMERWCLARAKNSGSTRIAVLNPACVYGPGGKTYSLMPFQMASEGMFCWIEEGKGIANYTFIDNLIDAILLAVTCREAHGQRFIINDGFCEWRDFLSPVLGEFAESLSSFGKDELAIMNQYHRAKIKDLLVYLASNRGLLDLLNQMPAFDFTKKALTSVPKIRHKVQAMRQQSTAPFVSDDEIKIKAPPEWLGELFGPTRTKFSSEKATRVLGWKPLVSLEAGQKRTRQWLASLGLLKQVEEMEYVAPVR